MIPTDVGIEVPGRLVANEERRMIDHRPRDRDAAAATGELLRARAHLVREPDEVHDLGNLLADLRVRLALNAERVADVLGGGAVREELEVLEDAAEVAAQERHLRALEPSEVAPRR